MRTYRFDRFKERVNPAPAVRLARPHGLPRHIRQFLENGERVPDTPYLLQRELFSEALDELEVDGELTNQILEVALEDSEAGI